MSNSKANRNVPTHDPTNFFAGTWIVIAILFIFPPAGIYLLWKNQKFDPAIRIILSILFGIVFIYNTIGWLSPDTQPKPPSVPPAQVGDSSTQEETPSSDPKDNPASVEEYIPPVLPAPRFENNRLMKVHFLDVGQADSIVIQTTGGHTYLVDGGNAGDSEFIIDYLHSLGVTEISAVVATHPHEDHIGGLPEILNNFKVQEVYMPDITHTTKTFEDFVNAVKNNSAKTIRTKVGTKIPSNEPFLSMIFLAPNRSGYESLNNYSAVLKVSYKDVSFLLTGDAENVSEREMIELNRNVNATVLKVGHHGSKTSSSTQFLKTVKPMYAVMSLGKDNEYGYPHAEAVQRINETNASLLRTDVLGTIVMETDGEQLGIKTIK